MVEGKRKLSGGRDFNVVGDRAWSTRMLAAQFDGADHGRRHYPPAATLTSGGTKALHEKVDANVAP